MGDEFEFIPPPRREARTFEPPPWEKEAFEELRRKREAAEAEEAAAVELAVEEQAAAIETQGVAEELLIVSPTEASPVSPPLLGQEQEAEGLVSEGEVVAMLAQLAAQEPNAKRPITTVALVVAVVSGVFGLVLLVWGVVALAGSRASGRVAMIGGSLFFILGIAAVLFAVWLTVKTLRQRGVL